MPDVELTRHLYRFFPQLPSSPIEVMGDTVAEVVAALDVLAPGLAFYLCDERGSLRPHVNVFVDREPLLDRETLGDGVAPGTVITIMQALSGG